MWYNLADRSLASAMVNMTPAMRARGRVLERVGFKPIDALHITAAEQGQAEVLVTCDDGLLKTAQRHAGLLQVKVMSVLRFIAEEIGGMVQEKRRLIPAELKRVGWEALVHKLGLADATRFLLAYEAGCGDYVQLKEQLFAGKTVDELCDAIEQQSPKVQRQ